MTLMEQALAYCAVDRGLPFGMMRGLGIATITFWMGVSMSSGFGWYLPLLKVLNCEISDRSVFEM